MTNKSILLLALATVCLLAGCAIVGPGSRGEAPDMLRAGESFGFCAGYCDRVVEIDPLLIQHFEFAKRAGASLPDRTQTRPNDTARWHRLASLVDEPTFAALDSVYGCPDCADGGAEWLELRFGGVTRRVTFEYNRPPASVERLADSLRAIRQSFSYE